MQQVAFDLVDSYRVAMKRLGGGGRKLPDAIAEAQKPVEIISAVTHCFRENFVPTGGRFAVSIHKDRFCLGLPVECPWNGDWNVLEAKKLLDAARRVGPAISALIIPFLKLLTGSTQIATWYNAMDYAEDWVDERIADGYEYDIPEQEHPDEGHRTLVEDLNCFRTGAAAQMADSIKEAGDLSAEELIVRLTRIRKPSKLKDALINACKFFQEGLTVVEFDRGELAISDEDYFDNGIPPLPFYEQNTLLWQFDFALTDVWHEHLNSVYQESGIIPPIGVWWMDARRKDWSDKAKDQIRTWPSRLQETFQGIDEACGEILKTPKEKKTSPKAQLINILV